MKIVVFAAAFFCLLIAGCGNKQSGTLQGPLIANQADLNISKLAFPKATLSIGGTELEAEVRAKSDEEKLTIESSVSGVVLDTEEYQLTEKEVSVATVTGETFTPAVPIIKYGMHVGDAWKWEGKSSAGGIEHQLSASITTTGDNLFVGSVALHDVVRVDVTLQYDSGTDTPALRKLQFWLVKDKGIVKRSFGGTLIREPRE